MAEYEELIEALRHCYEDDDACATCQRWLAHDEWGIKCKGRLISDAAAAIEELDAEETRLLMITSELQDKVVELEEELNDADVAADDNARQIEALQAEVDTLKRTDSKRCQECLYLGQPVGEQLIPKRGKWKYIVYHNGCTPDEDIVCSVCGKSGWDHWNYCPNCGSLMRGEANERG